MRVELALGAGRGKGRREAVPGFWRVSLRDCIVGLDLLCY
jgi:hypothetical protein